MIFDYQNIVPTWSAKHGSNNLSLLHIDREAIELKASFVAAFCYLSFGFPRNDSCALHCSQYTKCTLPNRVRDCISTKRERDICGSKWNRGKSDCRTTVTLRDQNPFQIKLEIGPNQNSSFCAFYCLLAVGGMKVVRQLLLQYSW